MKYEIIRVGSEKQYSEELRYLFNADIIDALVDRGYRGIVIAGTGLGHVNKPLYPALKKAIDQGVHVVMTVQTLWGYAQMYVYDTGRDLLDIGVVPLDNMLPEKALMKLSWVLGHTDDHDDVLEMILLNVRIAHALWNDRCHVSARGYRMSVHNHLDAGEHRIALRVDPETGTPVIGNHGPVPEKI